MSCNYSKNHPFCEQQETKNNQITIAVADMGMIEDIGIDALAGKSTKTFHSLL